MNETDNTLIRLSAARMAACVQKREVTAEQIVRAHLARIDQLEPQISAFQSVRNEQAIEEARELDTRDDLGSLPLAGVPVAIKDNVDVAGEPTRNGTAATSSHPAQHDDLLVRRLRAAGCIVIGKTRLPELAIWPFTESTAYGDTRNPWATDRTPGGSSGGSAAAVAGHMAALALASDGGGSIRIPAACCGLAGIRPGPGRVPLAGGDTEHWLGMSEFGPLARHAEDAALMLDVLAGSNEPLYPLQTPSPLRIAMSFRAPTPGAVVAPEVTAALDKAASLLAAAGHQVDRADPPYPITISLKFLLRWLTGIARDTQGLPEQQLEQRTRAMARAGRWIKRLGWERPASADSFGTDMTRWFKDYDLLLTPTLSEPAIKVGKWRGKGWIATALDSGKWVFTTPWNVARFPAASVPVGLSRSGLPIGMQLVTPPGGEGLLLAAMNQIEQLTGTLGKASGSGTTQRDNARPASSNH